MFHVGQMVVCVEADPVSFSAFGVKFDRQYLLEKGRIYTIRRVGEYKFTNGIRPALWLEEVVRSSILDPDGPFGARRFRPVKETSIDCFTALLTKPPVEERI